MLTLFHLPDLPIISGDDWAVVNADCLRSDQVNTEEDKAADLAFADPPYNYGFNYGPGINDKRAPSDYILWCTNWIAILLSRLRPNGALWLMFPDEWVAEIDVNCRHSFGLERRNWIVWNETFGTNQDHKFSRCKRHLLYYIKPNARGAAIPIVYDKPTFNGNAVRIPSDRQLKYNDKRANPAGKVPGDVWQFSRIAGTFKERDGRVPTQVPEALLYRIVMACSGVGDRILEFFAGSGSLGRVVMRAGYGRTYEGWEQDSRTAHIAAERIREADLTLRGKPPINASSEESSTASESPEPGQG